jgi:alpha-L-fucosidase
MLADIVSKNGNLLLSIPVRGDGTIDSDETAFLHGMAKWMDVNGEAIFGTRPWTIYGEGPSTIESPEAGRFGGATDVRRKPYTARDVRFTTKAGSLYALLLDWPADRSAVITALATGSPQAAGHKITGVTLLGRPVPLHWTQDEAGLHVRLPETAPSDYVVALKIEGVVAR